MTTRKKSDLYFFMNTKHRRFYWAELCKIKTTKYHMTQSIFSKNTQTECKDLQENKQNRNNNKKKQQHMVENQEELMKSTEMLKTNQKEHIQQVKMIEGNVQTTDSAQMDSTTADACKKCRNTALPNLKDNVQ